MKVCDAHSSGEGLHCLLRNEEGLGIDHAHLPCSSAICRDESCLVRNGEILIRAAKQEKTLYDKLR